MNPQHCTSSAQNNKRDKGLLVFSSAPGWQFGVKGAGNLLHRRRRRRRRRWGSCFGFRGFRFVYVGHGDISGGRAGVVVVCGDCTVVFYCTLIVSTFIAVALYQQQQQHHHHLLQELSQENSTLQQQLQQHREEHNNKQATILTLTQQLHNAQMNVEKASNERRQVEETFEQSKQQLRAKCKFIFFRMNKRCYCRSTVTRAQQCTAKYSVFL